MLAAAGWALVALALPAAASADKIVDNQSVTSFDGTNIVYTLFEPDGASAAHPVPAILMTHGWGGSRSTSDSGFVNRLTKAGYAVLTWDQRGFGQSGGTVEIDDPNVEARDVSALIDALQARPEIARDNKGAKVGMAGGSYAGGIQWISAAIDPRIRAIAPEISWHNLVESLSPDGVIKTGWGSLLYAVGFTSMEGFAGDPGLREDPRIHQAQAEGLSLGFFTSDIQHFFRERGPYFLLDRVRVPTFIIQGTIDTLFPPSQGVENYDSMQALHPHQPLKMDWYCSGHGVCSFDPGPSGYVSDEIVNWFDRYVKGDRSVATGARFEYVTQDGKWHQAGGYPVAGTHAVSGQGSGVATANGEPTAGGVEAIGATVSHSALKVPIATGASTLIGAPHITLTETGAGAGSNRQGTRATLFFQVVDKTAGVVLGNQITPKVLDADGSEHTYSFDVEPVSYTVPAGDQIALQVVGTSGNYDVQRGGAVFDISDLKVSIPAL